MDEDKLAFLRTLGVAEPQARVYAALSGGPGLTAREASTRSGVGRTRVYAVLNSLVSEGLAREDDGRFVALPLVGRLEELSARASRDRQRLLARQDLLAALDDPAAGRLGPNEIRLVRGNGRPLAAMADALAAVESSVTASFSTASLARALGAPAVGDALREAFLRAESRKLVVHADASDARALVSLPPALLTAARIAPASGWRVDRVVVDASRAVVRAGGLGEAEIALVSRDARFVADASANVALVWAQGKLALPFISAKRQAAEQGAGWS